MTTATVPRKAEIGDWMGRAWDWLADDFLNFLLVGFFAALLLGVSSGLLAGPVLNGLALTSLSKGRKESVQLSRFFDGFRFPDIVWALVASLVIFLLVMVGLVFLIVPGMVIGAMYSLTFHYIVDEKRDFWDAMEASRRFIAQDYFGWTAFAALLAGINLIGLSVAGIGTIFTLPYSALAVTAAYLSQEGEALPPPPPSPSSGQQPPPPPDSSPIVID
ncbi:MAG TPA: hypothetical protein VLU25_21555 [Acidobacteriota bacterium]|nr:hypothetical protein [Acidobacteriota bacterium]